MHWSSPQLCLTQYRAAPCKVLLPGACSGERLQETAVGLYLSSSDAPSAVPRQTRGHLSQRKRAGRRPETRDTGGIQTERESGSVELRSPWLGGCLTRQGMVSMRRMRRTAASTHTVWPGSREVTLTDCSKCQGSRRQEGSWNHVKEHGSLQREKEA